MTKKEILKKMIMDRQVKLEDSECYGWSGSICGRGYPRIRYKKKTLSAHRSLCGIVIRRPLPKQYVIRTCKNKLCTNPKHFRISINSGLRRKPDDRKNNRHGRERLNLDLPTKLVKSIRKMAAKYNQTLTKYVGRRLLAVIKYENSLEKEK